MTSFMIQRIQNLLSSAHSKLAGEKTAMKSVTAAPLVLENVTVTQPLDSACAQWAQASDERWLSDPYLNSQITKQLNLTYILGLSP